MDEGQEREVAQGLRAGKAAAWQTLFEAYAERVWRSVARLLGPARAAIDDIVQETMLAAARSARTFDPAQGSLWSWLWGIARRHVALHFRKESRHDRLKDARAWLTAHPELAHWLEGQEPAPPEALAAAETTALVRATLTELAPDYEMLLTAKYLDGEPVEAIAQRERTSETAVRSKLARARQAFRQAFAKHADTTAPV